MILSQRSCQLLFKSLEQGLIGWCHSGDHCLPPHTVLLTRHCWDTEPQPHIYGRWLWKGFVRCGVHRCVWSCCQEQEPSWLGPIQGKGPPLCQIGLIDSGPGAASHGPPRLDSQTADLWQSLMGHPGSERTFRVILPFPQGSSQFKELVEMWHAVIPSSHCHLSPILCVKQRVWRVCRLPTLFGEQQKHGWRQTLLRMTR